MSAIRDLVNLRTSLERLARTIPARVASRAAQGITAQIRQDTAAGLDCYGRPFAPLAPATLARGRHPPPMVDTGGSLSETRAVALRGAGITIHVGGHYEHHLTSSGTRPAREVAPTRGPLPASWSRRVDNAAKIEAARGV